jgi:hypothetical protein
MNRSHSCRAKTFKHLSAKQSQEIELLFKRHTRIHDEGVIAAAIHNLDVVLSNEGPGPSSAHFIDADSLPVDFEHFLKSVACILSHGPKNVQGWVHTTGSEERFSWHNGVESGVIMQFFRSKKASWGFRYHPKTEPEQYPAAGLQDWLDSIHHRLTALETSHRR